MARIAQLLHDTTLVSVEHLKLDASNANKEGFVADIGLAAVPINIQPSSSQILMLTGGAYGKGYTVFTTASGILETDRLTVVSGSATPAPQYIVKGKQNFNYGLVQHLELYVEEVQ
jgi:hypothetical protein